MALAKECTQVAAALRAEGEGKYKFCVPRKRRNRWHTGDNSLPKNMTSEKYKTERKPSVGLPLCKEIAWPSNLGQTKQQTTMKNYKIKLQHDYGTVTLTLAALSEENAIATVMRIERCPRQSIVSVQVIN